MAVSTPSIDRFASSLSALMREYVDARKETFKGHKLHTTMREVACDLACAPWIVSKKTLRVKSSIGMGNWAVVPWVAILDTRETSSTQQGVYVILLFRADMTGLYVTLNQGITKPRETLGRVAARRALEERASAIRTRFPELESMGFQLEPHLDLRASRELVAELGASTIAQRFFAREGLDTKELLTTTCAASGIYDEYLQAPIRFQEISREALVANIATRARGRRERS